MAGVDEKSTRFSQAIGNSQQPCLLGPALRLEAVRLAYLSDLGVAVMEKVDELDDGQGLAECLPRACADSCS